MAEHNPPRPQTWQAAFELIRDRGHEHCAEPFRLASGQLSHDYIDGKYAVDTGERLALVSRAVAEAMAAGALERSDAQLAVSITGFAGPGGEDDEEGLVHFALADTTGALTHREEHFGPIGRDGVRIAALRAALDMLREKLDLSA